MKIEQRLDQLERRKRRLTVNLTLVALLCRGFHFRTIIAPIVGLVSCEVGSLF